MVWRGGMKGKCMKGITIVQLMLVMLIAGIVGRLVVDFVIDMRCEAGRSAAMCGTSKATPK